MSPRQSVGRLCAKPTAEPGRGARQVVDQPAHRDAVHPPADVHRRRSEPEQSEVAGAESREHREERPARQAPPRIRASKTRCLRPDRQSERNKSPRNSMISTALRAGRDHRSGNRSDRRGHQRRAVFAPTRTRPSRCPIGEAQHERQRQRPLEPVVLRNWTASSSRPRLAMPLVDQLGHGVEGQEDAQLIARICMRWSCATIIARRWMIQKMKKIVAIVPR